MRRSTSRLLRGGLWGALVAAAFALLAASAAAPPMFAEASGNAALQDQLATVPAGAVAGESPVVRIVGGEGIRGNGPSTSSLLRELDGIPGLGPGTVTATSIGVETRADTDEPFTPFVAAGDRTERARLFADDDLARALVTVPGSPRPGDAASGTNGGVWLPEPLAQRLGVAPGDPLRIGVQARRRVQAPTTVAGVYAVAADRRLPADPPGTRRWSLRRADVPADSEFGTLPAFLVVTDTATAGRLAALINDDLFYSVEAAVQPQVPTLAAATRTAAAIRERQALTSDPTETEASLDGLREQVVSGLPGLVAAATAVRDRTVAWTSTLTSAAVGLGLAAVLAVAVTSMVRRGVELRHAAGLGVRPGTVGLLAALEVLVVAAAGVVLGTALAWAVVAAVGPPGEVTQVSVRAAAGSAAVAAALGVLVVGLTAALAARRAGRLSPARSSARPVPWEAGLAVVAVTAVAGLLTRPDVTGPPGALDLLVPVLVLAAVGALGARLALFAAGRASLGARSLGRRPVSALAVRRLVSGGRQTVLVVTVLTTGLGLLLYCLTAAASVQRTAVDRTAVRAGAAATAQFGSSWLLDPGAPRLPPPPESDPPGTIPDPDPAPVPGVRNPPLPAGATVVWRSRTTVPPAYGNVDVLVVDPQRFAEVARWGSGPELARARALLAGLAGDDARVAAARRAGDRRTPVPALGIGAVQQRPGATAAVATLNSDVPIRVEALLDAFPGFGSLPMIVVPADSFFTSLGTSDPRVAPPEGSSRLDRPLQEFTPALWSARGPDALRTLLAASDLEPAALTTADRVDQEPDVVAARRSQGYQVALGVCLAAIAALCLAVFADRAAGRARAADLLLARMGLRPGGARRARVLELAVLVGLAYVLCVAGVQLVAGLGRQLLDPGGGQVPAFRMALDGPGVAAVAVAAAVTLLVAAGAARVRSAAATGTEVLREGD